MQPGRGNGSLQATQQKSVWLVPGTERLPVWLEVTEQKKKWFRDKISRSQIIQTFRDDKEFVFNLRSMKSHKRFRQGTDVI